MNFLSKRAAMTILTMISFYLGEDSYSHIPLLLGACTPFCMISPKERTLLFSTLAIPCVYFSLLYGFKFDLGFNVDTSIISGNIAVIRAVMWGFTFSFLVYVAYFFTSQATLYEENLQRYISNLNLEIIGRERAEANQLKAQHKLNMLMGILTHDLANHSQALSFYSSVLINDDASPIRRKLALDRVHKNALNIEEMIRNARHMQAVIAGIEELAEELVHLDTLLTKAEALMNHKLESKGINLKITLDRHAADWSLLCNETTFVNNILCNILSNAIKFSFQGATIHLDARRESNKMLIKISDEGIGIPKEFQDRIFELDKQSQRKGTKGEMGTGLGMPLCRYYCELFGGKISLEDNKNSNSGTTFILEFDFGGPANGLPLPKDMAQNTATITGAR